MYDFNQAIILSSRFHNLCKEHLAQWLPLFCPKYNKNSVPDYESCCLNTSKTNDMHNKSMTSTVITPFCITICKKKTLESSFYCFFLPNFPYYGYFNWNLTKKYSFQYAKPFFSLPMMHWRDGKIRIKLFFP